MKVFYKCRQALDRWQVRRINGLGKVWADKNKSEEKFITKLKFFFQFKLYY